MQRVLLSVHTYEALRINTVLCLLTFAVTIKEFWDRGQFQTSLSKYHHIGKPGQELKYDRNLETDTESELMGKSCLLE